MSDSPIPTTTLNINDINTLCTTLSPDVVAALRQLAIQLGMTPEEAQSRNKLELCMLLSSQFETGLQEANIRGTTLQEYQTSKVAIRANLEELEAIQQQIVTSSNRVRRLNEELDELKNVPGVEATRNQIQQELTIARNQVQTLLKNLQRIRANTQSTIIDDILRNNPTLVDPITRSLMVMYWYK
jgi:hypothetical protein